MQGRVYPDVFSRRGIEVIVPRDEEQTYIHDKYMNEARERRLSRRDAREVTRDHRPHA